MLGVGVEDVKGQPKLNLSFNWSPERKRFKSSFRCIALLGGTIMSVEPSKTLLAKMTRAGDGFGFLGHPIRDPKSYDYPFGEDYDAHDLAKVVDESVIDAAKEGNLSNAVELAVWANSRAARHFSDFIDGKLHEAVKEGSPLKEIKKYLTEQFKESMDKFWSSKEAVKSDYFLEEQVEWCEKLGIHPEEIANA